MSATFRIDRCEVCGSRELVSLLDLGSQPMSDDLVPIGVKEYAPSYPLELVGCNNCVTVHQASQVEKKLLFHQDYHYRAALTKDVITGMRELVESVENHVGDLSGKNVLDIGCNDGSLLSIFKEKGGHTAGIEPTGAIEDARKNIDWAYHGFFDSDAVDTYLNDNPKPDFITFTNVFAHIEDLNGLLDNLKSVMHENTRLIVENHYLGAVVDKGQFDSFYHEHPRTYSLKSFEVIAQRLGRNLEHVEFPERYNGNIRVIMGPGEAMSRPDINESSFLEDVSSMRQLIDVGRERVHEELNGLVKQYGPLPGKAFPARASILTHCLEIDERLIDATYERSSSPKVGHYIPGTRIEIRDEAEFLANRMDSPVLVNFAWHIHHEISRYMKAEGFKGQVLPIWKA